MNIRKIRCAYDTCIAIYAYHTGMIRKKMLRYTRAVLYILLLDYVIAAMSHSVENSPHSQ